MRYIDVARLHSDTADPVRLVSEIGPDGYELRKLEFWADGRVGHAGPHGEIGGTGLGAMPVPSMLELNADSQFKGKEIDASQFATLWAEHTGR
jgi:hypothetical protein